MKKILAALTITVLLSTTGMASAAGPRVAMTTNHGVVVIELNAEAATKTIENFLSYVRKGFYDGTIFHRVIAGFMIQGGGFTAELEIKDTDAPIENEADKGIANGRGTIAMARTGFPHSATAQFFINLKDNGFLNHRDKSMQGWGYTAFGHVVEGMDVVDKIAGVSTGNSKGHGDVPDEPVIITKAVVK